VRAQERDYDANRRQNAALYHSARWRKVRAHVLRRSPLCVECEREGRTTVAQIVHHIVPVSEGGAPFDPDGLRGVCRPCHGRLHARKGQGIANTWDPSIAVSGGLMEQKAGPMKQEGIESEGGA
jgi:5-methylcytosine-specific restriction enzyme A